MKPLLSKLSLHNNAHTEHWYLNTHSHAQLMYIVAFFKCKYNIDRGAAEALHQHMLQRYASLSDDERTALQAYTPHALKSP